MTDIQKLIKECHRISRDHGFWKNENVSPIDFMLARIALMMSELGELVEAIRKDDLKNIEEELADTVIRIFDFAGGYFIDLEYAIVKKMKKNESRPYLHGKNS